MSKYINDIGWMGGTLAASIGVGMEWGVPFGLMVAGAVVAGVSIWSAKVS